ncbi:MAG: DUF4157 domain-containing protein [Fibrobacter sp.]|nr:DUF4157 domain-containing protein [Fibrobacter sp.]
MSTTYAQKQAPAQKKDAPSASSVLDASLQSEGLQRKADMANNAAQREEVPRPNNTGMPDNLKSGIESLSGFSMDDVRVHYNSSKPATVQALAYTQGTDIHVAPGQEKHLPHEAWHVAQQMAGRVSPTTNINGMPVNDNAALEHEADVMGEKAVAQQKKEKTECAQFERERKNFNAIQRNKKTKKKNQVKEIIALIGEALFEGFFKEMEGASTEKKEAYRLYMDLRDKDGDDLSVLSDIINLVYPSYQDSFAKGMQQNCGGHAYYHLVFPQKALQIWTSVKEKWEENPSDFQLDSSEEEYAEKIGKIHEIIRLADPVINGPNDPNTEDVEPEEIKYFDKALIAGASTIRSSDNNKLVDIFISNVVEKIGSGYGVFFSTEGHYMSIVREKNKKIYSFCDPDLFGIKTLNIDDLKKCLYTISFYNKAGKTGEKYVLYYKIISSFKRKEMSRRL